MDQGNSVWATAPTLFHEHTHTNTRTHTWSRPPLTPHPLCQWSVPWPTGLWIQLPRPVYFYHNNDNLHVAERPCIAHTSKAVCACTSARVCVRIRVIGLTVRVGWNDSVTFLSRGLCRADRDLAKRLAGCFLLCTLTGIINTHIIKTKIPRKTVRKSWSVPWQFWHVRNSEL